MRKWFMYMRHNMESFSFCLTQILSASPQYETLTEVLKLSVSCLIWNKIEDKVLITILSPDEFLVHLAINSFSSSLLFDLLIRILLWVSAVCQCQTQGQSQRECCPVLDGANSIMRSSLFCISLCCLYHSLNVLSVSFLYLTLVHFFFFISSAWLVNMEAIQMLSLIVF